MYPLFLAGAVKRLFSAESQYLTTSAQKQALENAISRLRTVSPMPQGFAEKEKARHDGPRQAGMEC